MFFIRLRDLQFVAALLFFNSFSFTQEVLVKWTAELEFSPKKLYFNHVLGEDTTNVYVLFTSDTTEHLMGEPDKKKLIAFNRETLLEIGSMPLKGFPEVNPEMEFHSCIIQDNQILLFWSKKIENTEELYVESLDSQLKMTQPARKIYSNPHAYDLKRAMTAKHKSSIVVCQNEKRKEDLLIGGEISTLEEYAHFEYGLLNHALNFSTLQTITLPFKVNKVSYGRSATYEYLENGDVLIRNEFTAEKGKGVTKNISEKGILLSNVNPYHTITYLKVKTGTISTVELPNTKVSFNKIILRSVFVNDHLRVYGLYTTGKEEKAVKGLFYAKFVIEDLSTKVEYLEFKQSTLDSLNKQHVTDEFYLQNVLSNNGKILFFLVPSNPRTVGKTISTVLGYDLNHEFQWINSIPTTSNEVTFYQLSKQNEIEVFYTMKKTNGSKLIIRTFGENTIGFSVLNTTTGEVTVGKEVKLDKPIFFQCVRFINNRLYSIHLGTDLLMNGRKGTGNMMQISIK
jgi:hypothetical protein